jgi:HSP20 family molecular chaperone IbpA
MNEREVSRLQERGAAVEIRKKGLCPDAVIMFQNIERRAQELFESNGQLLGHDLENWVRAESELFPPAPMKVIESADSLKLELDVQGFAAKELEVDLEPRRITVIGKHHTKGFQRIEGGRTSEERYTHLLRCLGLPSGIDTSQASARVNGGTLQVELKKVPIA